METTYTLGRFKYLVKFGSPTHVRVLKDGLRHDEKWFPTEGHFINYLKNVQSVD